MKKKIIGLVSLLLIVAAAGGYFYMQKTKDVVSSPEPREDQYSAYTYILDIYYSSNNTKRTKLIVMDIAIEVKNEIAKTKINENLPKIKGGVLKILSTEKYKAADDHSLLTFIDDNIKNDLAPLLAEISEYTFDADVHVTRLIIQ